ncbi:MAG: hypothetical protein BWY83_03243 [bacterium ADurb.Bin478]|nr:MAG: hypothetical protein BWY83_03243 [bacterium ADurb.Bin478]
MQHPTVQAQIDDRPVAQTAPPRSIPLKQTGFSQRVQPLLHNHQPADCSRSLSHGDHRTVVQAMDRALHHQKELAFDQGDGCNRTGRNYFLRHFLKIDLIRLWCPQAMVRFKQVIRTINVAEEKNQSAGDKKSETVCHNGLQS